MPGSVSAGLVGMAVGLSVGLPVGVEVGSPVGDRVGGAVPVVGLPVDSASVIKSPACRTCA
jgi:hypothetical protein